MENYLVVLKAQAAMLPKLLRVEHRYQRCDRRTDHDRSQAANPFTTVTEQLCDAMIGIFVPAKDGGIGGIQMLTIRRVSNDDRRTRMRRRFGCLSEGRALAMPGRRDRAGLIRRIDSWSIQLV